MISFCSIAFNVICNATSPISSVSAEVIRYKNEARAVKDKLDSLLFKIEKAGIKASFSENPKTPNDSKPVPSRREMECQLIFAAIMDSDIYKQNIEFFKTYRFESDFFGKLAKVYAYLWDKGTYDIIALLEEFKQRYGVDTCKLKSALAEGMKSVPSFQFVETCIAELSKYTLPRGTPRER